MAVNYNIPFQTQLDYMMYELQGPESRTMDAFKSGNLVTPQDYADAFDRLYERSDRSAVDRRKQYALEVFKTAGTDAFGNLPQNAQTAFNYFKGKGFTDAQAAGIVGNLMVESYSNIDPQAFNASENSYGIAQFRNSRLQGLLDFAGQQGDTSMDVNIGAPLQAQMKDPEKKGGLRGLLDFASERNPDTGLSRFEQFAAALDPLIMPEMRAGESIRKRGAQRVQNARVNKTIEWLRKNGYEDIAKAVEAKPQSAANVMSAVLAQRTKGTEQFRVATPEEAAKYGAVAGQFDKEGRFYPTQKTEITEVRDDTKFTEAGQREYAAVFSEMAAAGREANMNLGRIQLLGDLLDQGLVPCLLTKAADHRGDLRVEQRLGEHLCIDPENLQILSRCVENFDHGRVAEEVVQWF